MAETYYPSRKYLSVGGGTLSGNLIPATNNAYDLGTSSLSWKDLFLWNDASIGRDALVYRNIEVRGPSALRLGTTPKNGFYYRNSSAESIGVGCYSILPNIGICLVGQKNNVAGAVACAVGGLLNVTTANESTVVDNYTPFQVAYETSNATASAGYYPIFSVKKRSFRLEKTCTVSTMPASPAANDICVVTDANSDGGGSDEYTIAIYNGSAWIDIRSNAVLA